MYDNRSRLYDAERMLLGRERRRTEVRVTAAESDIDDTAEELSIAGSKVGDLKDVYLTDAQISSDFDASGAARTGTTHYGWAIANGSNGTQDLRDRFVRYAATGAGTTGGSDSNEHTHTGGAHTHDQVAHAHDAQGTLVARLKTTTTEMRVDETSTAQWTADLAMTATGYTRSASSATPTEGIIVQGSTASDGATTTGSGGAVATSGASATDNKPAYITLIPLQRIL